MTKRDFLRSATGFAALPFVPVKQLLHTVAEKSVGEVAQDEAFWTELRSHFTVTNDFIHLENGYYVLAANEVMDAFVNHVRDINKVSSYYMRTRQFDDKLVAREQLSELLSCPVEELIITRNTTESLDTIISGIDWKPGDEAVMAVQDYGAMLDMFTQQARRYDIVNKQISLPNHPKSDEEIVALYESAITPKTRLLMLCHIVNITGQILPVRKIADMAHRHGVEVMVDGAHAVGHFDFKLPDLGCDYYGSSLHKWLGNPLGAGLLCVRRDKIKNIWPMFGDAGFADDDIRKLNHTGTHPVHTDLTLPDTIRFHNMIGIARKEARLRYLQTYWTSKVRQLPNIILNTPADPTRACAIANVGVRGLTPGQLAKTLLDKYRIWTVAISNTNVQGVRVTPHLYTTTADLDAFVKALTELAA